MEHQTLLSAVNADLNKIDLKYARDNPRINSSLHKTVGKLYQEFESLGLVNCEPNNLKDVFADITLKALRLVDIHRGTIVDLQNDQIASTQLLKRNTEFEKRVDTLQKRLDERDNQIEALKRRLVLTETQVQDANKIKRYMERDMRLVRQTCESKLVSMKHELNRATIMHDKLEETVKLYNPSDVNALHALIKKLVNERQVYENTICELTASNQQLMNELLFIERDVATLCTKNDNITPSVN